MPVWINRVGLRGNFLDVPTDCPQRDERLGWTADAQVFTPTACYNVDAHTFYTKWLKDLAADQREDGAVPHIAPDVLYGYGSTGWGDAATVVPWIIYEKYGDKKILEAQYPSMKAWVDFMHGQSKNSGLIFNSGFHFGDWLAYSTNDSDYPGATTDKDLIATAYFARSTKILQKTAEVLGNTSDAAIYKSLFQAIQEAFLKEFVTSTGRLTSNTQTSYILVLSFDLLPDNLKPAAAKRLADDVNKFKHITTGFLGTPDICDVLTNYGYPDLAYLLLFRTQYPSWLYPVTQGATTIWERWDGQRPDGSFQDPGMNSFNHYAYGAIGNWMYSRIAGIQNAPGSIGYKNILIEPYPSEKLQYVRADYHSVYGTISSHWTRENGRFSLQVVIPANTHAEIRIPATSVESVRIDGISLIKKQMNGTYDPENKRVIIKTGSGKYDFTVD